MTRIWKQLSRGQRLCALVLSCAVLASAGLGLRGCDGAEPYKTLIETSLGEDSHELRAFFVRLDDDKIDWRPERLADGRVKIEVRAGLDFQRALRFAAEQGLEIGAVKSDDRSGGASFLVPTRGERESQKLEDDRERLQRQIETNPNIANVEILIQPAKPPVFALEKEKPPSAAVLIRLADGVDRLPARQAIAIRELVASAFAVRPEHVQVFDSQNLRPYPNDGSLEALQREDEIREKVRSVVETYYRSRYQKEEYRLGIVVGERTEKTDPEVRVNVLLDSEAVRDEIHKSDLLVGKAPKERAPDEFLSALRTYEREHAQALLDHIPLPRVKVSVKAEVFVARAARLTTLADRLETAEGYEDWIERGVLYGGSVLAFLLLVRILFGRRAVPAKRSESAAQDGSSSETTEDRADAEEPEIESNEAVDEDGLRICEATLIATRETGELVADRADVAASVLRFWLHDGEVPQSEGGA